MNRIPGLIRSVCFAAGLIVLLAPLCSSAELSGKIIRYGVFTKAIKTDGFNKEFKMNRVRRRTKGIPCAIGEIFGIVFSLEGFPNEASTVELVATWTHPEFPDPKTGEPSSVTRDRWKASAFTGDVLLETALWKFEHSEQLVPGAWSVAVSHNESVGVEKAFEITKCKTPE